MTSFDLCSPIITQKQKNKRVTKSQKVSQISKSRLYGEIKWFGYKNTLLKICYLRKGKNIIGKRDIHNFFFLNTND